MISVGIDIGRSSIKVAEAEAISKSFVIRRVHEIPLSTDPTKDRKIEIIDALRSFIPQYNPDTTRFIFCVRQEDVSQRLKKFPFRERHKILKAVPFEVEDEIPFSFTDAVFEAKIVRFEGRMADVLAMACPRDRIKNILQLARDGGAVPSILSLETLALSNFFEKWWEPPPEKAPSLADIIAEKNGELLLDIGHASTRCLFYEDGVLVAIRHVDWGGRNIIAQVAQKYGLSALQALREVEAKSFIALDKSTATKDQANFSKVIETACLDLVRELRLKILEVKADHQLNISRAHMTGGVTLMRGLGGFLTQHLEIAFNRLKLFSLLPSASFEVEAKTEAVSGVAIGLAIEGLRRPRNPAADFLKMEFANQSQTWDRFWDKWGYTAQLGSAAFCLFLIHSCVRDSMSSSMVDASQEALKNQAAAVANIKGSGTSPAKIKKFLSNHENEQKARKQAEKVLKLNSALDVLNLVSQNVPEHTVLDIKHFSVDSDIVEIQGLAVSVAEVMKAFQAASSNGKVETVPVQYQAAGGKQPFGFRFHVNRLEGGG